MERRFPKEELKDAGLPFDGDFGFEIVLDEITSKSRWSVNHRLVFKYENRFYETSYSVGATEQQDELPWQYDKEVICKEVQPIEKVVIDYVPIS